MLDDSISVQRVFDEKAQVPKIKGNNFAASARLTWQYYDFIAMHRHAFSPSQRYFIANAVAAILLIAQQLRKCRLKNSFGAVRRNKAVKLLA
jgi:hypothetical protein